MKQLIKVIILLIICILILTTSILAVSDIFSQASNWIGDGKTEAEAGKTMDTTELESTSDLIYNIFLGVGTSIVVIVGAILGIQFMTAGVDKKVEVKQALVPYIVSSIVLFGALGIWKFVIIILNEITK